MSTSNRFPIEEQFSKCEPHEPGRIHVLDLNENILKFLNYFARSMSP